MGYWASKGGCIFAKLLLLLLFFFFYMDRDKVEVHKHAINDQYLAILTERAWTLKDFLY